MPTKTGAGDNPQEYDKNTGRYAKGTSDSDNGDKDFFRTAERTIEKEKQKAAQDLVYALDKVKDLKSLLGEEFKGYKGQAAVDKLVKEQRGHIKAAFHRDDIGDIDLIWGNDSLGLQHIIKQRTEEMNKNGKSLDEKKKHIDRLLNNLADTIENGVFKKVNKRGSYEIKNKYFYAVVAPTYHQNKLVYVLTAFERK